MDLIELARTIQADRHRADRRRRPTPPAARSAATHRRPPPVVPDAPARSLPQRPASTGASPGSARRPGRRSRDTAPEPRAARGPPGSSRRPAAGPATSSGQLSPSRRRCPPVRIGLVEPLGRRERRPAEDVGDAPPLVLARSGPRPRPSGRPARTPRSTPPSTPPGRSPSGRSTRVVERASPRPPARPGTFGSGRRPSPTTYQTPPLSTRPSGPIVRVHGDHRRVRR